jgi:hypothetical protein
MQWSKTKQYQKTNNGQQNTTRTTTKKEGKISAYLISSK